MKSRRLAVLPLFVFAFGFQPLASATDTVDADVYSGLEWRGIGPWRGGRVTAVTGVPGWLIPSQASITRPTQME